MSQKTVHASVQAAGVTRVPHAKGTETNVPRQVPRNHAGIGKRNIGWIEYAPASPTTMPMRMRSVRIVHMRAVPQIPGVEDEAKNTQRSPNAIAKGMAMAKRFCAAEQDFAI